MGKKREMVRLCDLVRDLIDAQKYTLALEEVDKMELVEIPSIEDLYLFADLYERAERLEKKKEIFYEIYERTHSRHILYQLLRLLIRMGDLDEAKELFLAYEVLSGITLDTYELRYRLAKAEGEPRTRLIEILEELKKEEYTEEWGYQLALLYEMEGERQKCIHECEDIKLWFGEGRIVERAMELKARCEDKDWEPPKNTEIPEPIEIEEAEGPAYAIPPVDVTEMTLADDLSEDVSKLMTTAQEEEHRLTEDSSGGAEPEEELSGETKSIDNLLGQTRPIDNLSGGMEPESASFGGEQPIEEPAMDFEEGVSEVRPTPRPKNAVEKMPEPEESYEEEAEDVSDRGVRYRNLKSTMHRIKRDKGEAHFVFVGEERIALAVAKRVTKELNHVGSFSAQSIVKIAADKLNGLKLADQAEKLKGGCMLVINAPELTKEAVAEMIEFMEANRGSVVVMLAGPFDEMDCFLSIYPELEKMFPYKVRL